MSVKIYKHFAPPTKPLQPPDYHFPGHPIGCSCLDCVYEKFQVYDDVDSKVKPKNRSKLHKGALKHIPRK